MIDTKIESQTVEFKQIWKDEYLKTICAFANTDGGTLCIGINDTGEVLGLKDIKSLIETLPNKINNRLGLIVDLVVKNKNNLEYLQIVVQKTYAPVSINGIEGNLFEQLEKIIDTLRTKYLHSFITYEGLQRIETLEYPYEAVREIVINALIHRDYSDTTVLLIRVYEDKLIFTNGATLSHEVPIEKFKEDNLSKPFNPTITKMFY